VLAGLGGYGYPVVAVVHEMQVAYAVRADDLVERHDAVAVRGLAAQAVRQRGQDLAPPRAQKVVLDVCLRESGI